MSLGSFDQGRSVVESPFEVCHQMFVVLNQRLIGVESLKLLLQRVAVTFQRPLEPLQFRYRTLDIFRSKSEFVATERVFGFRLTMLDVHGCVVFNQLPVIR